MVLKKIKVAICGICTAQDEFVAGLEMSYLKNLSLTSVDTIDPW